MKSQIKFSAIIILLGIILVVIIILGIHSRFKPPKQVMPVPSVSTTTIQEQTWQPSISSTGLLHAYEGTMITVEVAGRVTAVHFHSGDAAKADQVLVELDNGTQEGAVAQAQANLILSQSKYDRVKKLYKTKVVSQDDYDQVLSAYQLDLAHLKTAEADLDKTIIKAPFSGVLGIEQVSLGNYVTPGVPIVSLQNVDSLYVDFDVPAKYLNELKVGQVASLTIQTNAKPITIQAHVTAIDSVVHSDTGSITIRASVENAKHNLRPGQFATIDLLIGAPEKVLTVPQMAIAYSDEGSFIYRIVDQKTVKTVITPGKQKGQAIVVTGSIHPGDVIIKDSNAQIQDKIPVHIVLSSASAAG